MIRLPVPYPMREAFSALWQNRTPDGGAYAHLLLSRGCLFSFNERKRCLIAYALPRHSVFLDMLESYGDVLLDLDRSQHEILQAECSDFFDLESCRIKTDGGEEIGRKVIPAELPASIAMHAIREESCGYLSMKQLQPLKHLQALIIVLKADGATIAGEHFKIFLRHRDVKRPRISTGYAKYLAEYPEDGIVYI